MGFAFETSIRRSGVPGHDCFCFVSHTALSWSGKLWACLSLGRTEKQLVTFLAVFAAAGSRVAQGLRHPRGRRGGGVSARREGRRGGRGGTCCSAPAVNRMACWCCSSSMSMCRSSRKSFLSSSIQPSSSWGEAAAHTCFS